MTVKRLAVLFLVAGQMLMCGMPPGEIGAQPKNILYDVDFMDDDGAGHGIYAQMGSTGSGGIFYFYDSVPSTFPSISFTASATAPSMYMFLADNLRFSVLGATGAMTLGGSNMSSDPYMQFLTSGADGQVTWDYSESEFVFNSDVRIATTSSTLVLGSQTSGGDPNIYFDTSGQDGQLSWSSASNSFNFGDDVTMQTTKRMEFYDASQYIYATDTSNLTIGAYTQVFFSTPLVTAYAAFQPGTTYNDHNGSPGLIRTITVKGSDGNDCNLGFSDGILISETCP